MTKIKIKIGKDKPDQKFAILKQCPKCKQYSILLCVPEKVEPMRASSLREIEVRPR